MKVDEVVTQAFESLARCSEIASVYGITTRAIFDAIYSDRVKSNKSKGVVLVLWDDAERLWGKRPDRFVIAVNGDEYQVVEVTTGDVKTVVRDLGVFNTLYEAQYCVEDAGVKRRFLGLVLVDEFIEE